MKTVIIDVRTPKEFSERTLPGAINIPSSQLKIEDFTPYQNDHIALLCQSGRRAEGVMEKLQQASFENVSVMKTNMAAIIEESNSDTKWSVDRQFRMALAIFIGIFLIGFQLDWFEFILIPLIVFQGLLFSAITDNCYLKEAIAKMPWNRSIKTKLSLEP